ncbi:MAG: acylphosphatase [Dissulfurispiraceae bacterium]|jgi:acylphosphatase|nr:acylphosphatase [Dissulfurispiraceae bacterium]
MIQRIHLSVSGQVQGVFYRAFTKKNADSLGIKGWVRNMPDGSVEAVIEGEKEAIDSMIQLCRQGPPASCVDNVVANPDSSQEDFDGFQIRY